jgi:hypothetical protein
MHSRTTHAHTLLTCVGHPLTGAHHAHAVITYTHALPAALQALSGQASGGRCCAARLRKGHLQVLATCRAMPLAKEGGCARHQQPESCVVHRLCLLPATQPSSLQTCGRAGRDPAGRAEAQGCPPSQDPLTPESCASLPLRPHSPARSSPPCPGLSGRIPPFSNDFWAQSEGGRQERGPLSQAVVFGQGTGGKQLSSCLETASALGLWQKLGLGGLKPG